MKLLFTCESYHPTVCGVSEVVRQIAEGLVEKGHDVTVATSFSPERTRLEHNGVHIRQFNVRGKWTRGYRGEIQDYRKFLRYFDCDIMLNYAAQEWSADLVFPIIDRLSYKRVLVPCGYPSLENWKWKPYYWLLPATLRKYDHIIYHCDNLNDKKFGDRHGINHYSIVPNGASKHEFETRTHGFKKAFGITRQKLVLCVSNYGPLKNQEFVIRAFENAHIDDCVFVLIGSKFNEYSRYLKETVVKKPDSVLLLENVPRHTLVTALFEADLFLFGSKTEYFPVVILEAMASATPFISTDVGCVSRLPGGVITNSIGEMSDAIRSLFSNSGQRQMLAAEGRKAFLERFNWEEIINRYEDLFMNLVTSPQK